MQKSTILRIFMPVVFLLSTSISILVGSRPAQGAASCITGEHVYMATPEVTVIEGLGDPAAEQSQWSALEVSVLRGGLEMGLGERTWYLEPVR